MDDFCCNTLQQLQDLKVCLTDANSKGVCYTYLMTIKMFTSEF
jgi:hypothetical protein